MVVVMKPGTRQQADIRQAGVPSLKRNGSGSRHYPRAWAARSWAWWAIPVALDDRRDHRINEHVERVMRVQEPYKKANRKFHPEDTVVDVNGIQDRRRQLRRHRRPLLRGERGADHAPWPRP